MGTDESSEIKAIFFDFGGVLLKTFDGVDHDAIEAEFGLEAKMLRKCVVPRQPLHGLPGREVHVRRVGGLDPRGAAEDRRAGGRDHERVHGLAARVQSGDARAGEAAARPIHAGHHLEHDSGNGGAAARAVRAGRSVRRAGGLRRSRHREAGRGDLSARHRSWRGSSPEQSVFTDDRADFAEAARAVGMQGFHFTEYERFVEDLRSVGVEA